MNTALDLFYAIIAGSARVAFDQWFRDRFPGTPESWKKGDTLARLYNWC